MLAYPKKRKMNQQASSDVTEKKNVQEIDRLFHVLQTYNSAICSAISGRRVHVFGTTVNAAFVQEMWPDRVVGFVDESVVKRDIPFRNLPVKHPSELLDDEIIFFPPGMSEVIIDRVKKQNRCSVLGV